MSSTGVTRSSVGLGFLPEEARHGFLVEVPRGVNLSDLVCISEHRGADLDRFGERHGRAPDPADRALRVLIDRARCLALAPSFWYDANRRLRANGLPVARFVMNPVKPVPVHASFGKELCVLCWAVEDAPPAGVAPCSSSASRSRTRRRATSPTRCATGRRSPPKSVGGSTR